MLKIERYGADPWRDSRMGGGNGETRPKAMGRVEDNESTDDRPAGHILCQGDCSGEEANATRAVAIP
jgi:hypothetical protein